MEDIVEKAKGLLEGITPGPWGWEYGQLVSKTVDPEGVTGDGVVMNEPGINKPEPQDAQLIAAAPQLVRELVAEVELLRQHVPKSVMKRLDIQQDAKRREDEE